jgi:predicted TIM-barrel fold metal-dependent hydrolase
MRNTGITYRSDEHKPQILQEFAELLPALTEEQRQALEVDILQNGCYSPIIVDEELHIVDGHNRQQICEEHNLPYTMAVFEFVDKLEAMQWALDTQKGRRNLDKWELGKIALKLKPEIEARAKANQQEYHGNQYDSGLSATLPEVHSSPVDTRKELADSVGLGERTMGKVMQIDENAPEAVKQALDKGELSVNKGYEITKKLAELPEEEREIAAAEALEYEKAKRELAGKNAEIDRRSKIANLYCKAFEKAILLEVSEENVRIWTDCCRMRENEIADNAKEAREIAGYFTEIAEIIEDKILAPGYFEEDGDDDDDVEYLGFTE